MGAGGWLRDLSASPVGAVASCWESKMSLSPEASATILLAGRGARHPLLHLFRALHTEAQAALKRRCGGFSWFSMLISRTKLLQI